MSDKYHSLVESLLQQKKFPLQFVSRKRIECAEGLVHEQYFGIGGQCPCYSDALPLAAG